MFGKLANLLSGSDLISTCAPCLSLVSLFCRKIYVENGVCNVLSWKGMFDQPVADVHVTSEVPTSNKHDICLWKVSLFSQEMANSNNT